MICPPCDEKSTSAKPIPETFQKTFVVNLDRHANRWSAFKSRIPADFPFATPERFSAVDGKKCPVPAWWRQGGGAWGCFRSHQMIIEQCLNSGVDSVLFLEDDALFAENFTRDVTQFLQHLPGDWEMAYLGGQHLSEGRHPPQKINDWVFRPHNVNRTHAFALRGTGLKKVYRWMNDQREWRNYHIDHHLGRLHASRRINVYCPSRWLVAQAAGQSSIAGRSYPTRFWNHAEQIAERAGQDTTFVAVVGLHRSGSSCVATMLVKLGVHMGNVLGGYEVSGGGEAEGLAQLCERAATFPATEFNSLEQVEADLRSWINERRREAKRKGAIAGGKYPHLCALGDQLQATCGKSLKVIHCVRPIEESIESLKRRSAEAKRTHPGLVINDQQAEAVQRWLWEEKERFLRSVEHLDIGYARLLDSPADVVYEIIEYLGISPSDDQINRAIQHVDAKLRHVDSSRV